MLPASMKKAMKFSSRLPFPLSFLAGQFYPPGCRLVVDMLCASGRGNFGGNSLFLRSHALASFVPLQFFRAPLNHN